MNSPTLRAEHSSRLHPWFLLWGLQCFPGVLEKLDRRTWGFWVIEVFRCMFPLSEFLPDLPSALYSLTLNYNSASIVLPLFPVHSASLANSTARGGCLNE